MNSAEETYKRNLEYLDRELTKLWAPPPKTTVSSWAQEYRWLSPESNVGRIKWHNETMPHLIEPMDCLSASQPWREVVCKFPSQDGKTEIGLNWIAYIMKIDPGPTMVIQPNERPMGEAWAKERFQPMVRDTPELEGIVGKVNARTGTTVLHKQFSGGHLSVVGANSPAGLASRPIRYRHVDEQNRYPISAGKEGSPVALSEKRQRRFKLLGIDKSLFTSSPTFEDVGIDSQYSQCDVKKQWQVRCLDCGEFQYPKREKHIIWTDNDPSTTIFRCEHCGYQHDQKQELQVKATGRWVTIADNGEKRSIGFHKSMYTSSGSQWAAQIKEWLECEGDQEAQQVYVNTEEAENFEVRGESIDELVLMQRRERYDYQVPDGAYIITQAVDVQGNRFEIDVKGWGEGFESWAIERNIIYCDPTESDSWLMLLDHLTKSFESRNGPMRAMRTMIDSGFLSDEVYDFCWRNRSKKIYAVKGTGEITKPLVSPPTRHKLQDGHREIDLYIIGTNAGKLLVHHRFSIESPGPGYCHFPLDYDKEYFKQLASEHCVTRKRAGQMHRIFELRPGRSRRNEALDNTVYNTAAIKLINPVWTAIKKRSQNQESKESKPEKIDKPVQRRSRAKPRQRNWVTDWR